MNRYEVHFEGEKIGDADNFNAAMDIATEILETIKKYPKEKDEYQLLQIHCYWWFDRLFGIRDKNGIRKYSIVLWSEKENKFVTADGE